MHLTITKQHFIIKWCAHTWITYNQAARIGYRLMRVGK